MEKRSTKKKINIVRTVYPLLLIIVFTFLGNSQGQVFDASEFPENDGTLALSLFPSEETRWDTLDIYGVTDYIYDGAKVFVDDNIVCTLPLFSMLAYVHKHPKGGMVNLSELQVKEKGTMLPKWRLGLDIKEPADFYFDRFKNQTRGYHFLLNLSPGVHVIKIMPDNKKFRNVTEEPIQKIVNYHKNRDGIYRNWRGNNLYLKPYDEKRPIVYDKFIITFKVLIKKERVYHYGFYTRGTYPAGNMSYYPEYGKVRFLRKNKKNENGKEDDDEEIQGIDRDIFFFKHVKIEDLAIDVSK